MMSARALAQSKPIEIFGQDESVFSQFLFPPRKLGGTKPGAWALSKIKWRGKMISAFVSRHSAFFQLMKHSWQESTIIERANSILTKLQLGKSWSVWTDRL
jgi:hypothetical protein